MDKVYGNLFENGINKIEKYLVTELESMKIVHGGVVTKHATNFIQQIDSCSINDFVLIIQLFPIDTFELTTTSCIIMVPIPILECLET